MQQIAELIPVVLFFLAYRMDGTVLALWSIEYRFDGIYSATAVLMAATALQVVLTRLLSGHLEKRLLILAGVVMAFGGATLLFHNQVFIQWKPTIFNWALAAAFAGTRWWTGRSALEKAMGSQLQLPPEGWLKLDRLWTLYFLVVGALNLFVAYRFSEATWVSYKLYSSIGFTLLITLVTVALLAPYLQETPDSTGPDKD
jgi:intracellular septation protein